MAKKAVAKPLALLVRSNRDVFNAKMPGLDDHLNQRAQLSAFFVKVNDMLPNCLMVIGGQRERFTAGTHLAYGALDNSRIINASAGLARLRDITQARYYDRESVLQEVS